MQTHARGRTCIGQHIKETFLWGTMMCPEMGKQNLKAKKGLFCESCTFSVCKRLQKTYFLVQYPLVMHLKLIATKGSQTTARARVYQV